MTNTLKLLTGGALASFILLVGFVMLGDTFKASAEAPSGLPATVATSSSPTVGTTASLIFATSTCAARTITTVASPVMLTFSDNQGRVPTAISGHLQAASTTVTYDSGQFGCDAVRAYGFVSSAITITESR